MKKPKPGVTPGPLVVPVRHKPKRHGPAVTPGPLVVRVHPGRKPRHSGRRHHHSRHLSLNEALNGALTEDQVKFGRTEPYTRQEKPRLVIEHHLDTSALPPPPAYVDRASKVADWPMYGNDSFGDCTIATVGHEIEAWSAYADVTGVPVVIPESAIVKAYSAVSGYDPVTGANDNGANIQDVLNYWRKTGVGGHHISGFAELSSLDNLTLAKQCLDIFGTVYLGINVPQSAVDQFHAGQPWSYTGDQNIVGGHAIPVQKWGTHETGEIEVVTWGQLQRMTRTFWYEYVEEAWVVFSDDWLTARSDTIEGFDIEQLRNAFTMLTGQAPTF